VVSSMRPAAGLDNPPTGEQFILNPAVDSRRTFAGGGERIPEATTGTESLQTLCWREPDSNHRSRSCERLFWALPIGDGGAKGGATYRFRSENGNVAWSGCPQPFPSWRDREFEFVFLQQRVSNELYENSTRSQPSGRHVLDVRGSGCYGRDPDPILFRWVRKVRT
jgi:hypothetical protein